MTQNAKTQKWHNTKMQQLKNEMPQKCNNSKMKWQIKNDESIKCHGNRMPQL
jgi:hypothetical protein